MSLFGLQFQPSELAKGALILSAAQILSAMQTENGAGRRAMKYILLVAAVPVLFICVENLSTAALLCVVLYLMMMIGRVPGRQLGLLLGTVVLALGLVFTTVMVLVRTRTKR